MTIFPTEIKNKKMDSFKPVCENHTSSLINTEKALNRGQLFFNKKQSFIRNNAADVNEVLKTKC